jgi:hypothetical protein
MRSVAHFNQFTLLLMPKFPLVLVFLLISLSLFAQSSANTASVQSFTTEAKVPPTTPDSLHYSIQFCGRKGFPGHAFIALRRENTRANQLEQCTYGLFPKKLNMGYLSVLVPVRGAMHKEKSTRTDYSYTLDISREEYQKGMVITDQWSERPRFYLLWHDCVSYTQAVANIFKDRMQIPRRWFFDSIPVRYIRKLIAANTKTKP